MIDGKQVFTWREFAERVEFASGVLSQMGQRRGSRYAVLSHNSRLQAEVLQAGYRMGAVPVPINYRLAPAEIRAILDDAGAELLILGRAFSGLLENEELRPWRARTMWLDATGADPTGPVYETELSCAKPLPAANLKEEEVALLLYTGGTTGRSKGVCLTHRNLSMVALQNAAKLAPLCDDIYLHVAPMFHSADLLGNAYLACGAAHGYLAKPSARNVLEAIEKQDVTAIVLPPTLLILMLKDELFGGFDLSGLQTLVFGSAPMSKFWIQTASDVLPSTDLWHGYGLTETSQMLTLDRVPRRSETACPEDEDRMRSAGRALIGTDLRILDDGGQELPTGAVGEVAVRGPQVANGYHNMPVETVMQFKDGWFYTGDLGRLDGNGYLYLLDRKKDMVITGGENVYSFEVEEALLQHPDIAEAAVFGIPDDVFGESLMAVLVPKADAIVSDEDVIAHCRKLIGGYKIPRQILFAAELPKNALGKTIKDQLRRQHVKPRGVQHEQT